MSSFTINIKEPTRTFVTILIVPPLPPEKNSVSALVHLDSQLRFIRFSNKRNAMAYAPRKPSLIRGKWNDRPGAIAETFPQNRHGRKSARLAKKIRSCETSYDAAPRKCRDYLKYDVAETNFK